MNHWQLICHRSELAKSGDYVLLGGDTPMLAYNDAGNIIVTDNICPHRGSKMMDGDCGNKALVCPYHGWAYREGELHIPQREKFDEATLAKAKLRQYLIQWVGDFLFAGIGMGRLEEQLDDLGPLLSGISTQMVKREDSDSMPMPCDWRVAVENTLEDYHVPTVHRDTFGKLALTCESMERHGKNSIAYYKVGDERTVKGLKALAQHFEDGDPEHYFHLYIYPYACISSAGGFTFSLQHYLPQGGWTAFSSRLYSGKTHPGAPDMRWFYSEAAQFNKRVFQQDSEICSRVMGFGSALGADELRVKWFRENWND